MTCPSLLNSLIKPPLLRGCVLRRAGTNEWILIHSNWNASASVVGVRLSFSDALKVWFRLLFSSTLGPLAVLGFPVTHQGSLVNKPKHARISLSAFHGYRYFYHCLFAIMCVFPSRTALHIATSGAVIFDLIGTIWIIFGKLQSTLGIQSVTFFVSDNGRIKSEVSRPHLD